MSQVTLLSRVWRTGVWSLVALLSQHLHAQQPIDSIEHITSVWSEMPQWGAQRIDPFDPQHLQPAHTQSAAGAVTPQDTSADHALHPLQRYALESLRMVGWLGRKGEISALVQAPQHIYVVREGDALGRNGGQVERITPEGLQVLKAPSPSSAEPDLQRVYLSLQPSTPTKRAYETE